MFVVPVGMNIIKESMFQGPGASTYNVRRHIFVNVSFYRKPITACAEYDRRVV